MLQYSFETIRCKLSSDTISGLPDDVVEVCNNAIAVFLSPDTCTLCDTDAFCELMDRVSELNDDNSIMLKRHLFGNAEQIVSAEDLAKVLWNWSKKYKNSISSAVELEIEMRSYNMEFNGTTSANQYIEIKFLSKEGNKCESDIS